MPKHRSSKSDTEAKKSSRKKIRYVVNFNRVAQSPGRSNHLQVKESSQDSTGQNGISVTFFLELFLASVSDLMMMMRGRGVLEFFHGCGKYW